MCRPYGPERIKNGVTRTSKVRYGLIRGEFWCMLKMVKDATDINSRSGSYKDYYKL